MEICWQLGRCGEWRLRIKGHWRAWSFFMDTTKWTLFPHGVDATPAWDHYARTIDAALARVNTPVLTAAIDYLLMQPPKKQILDQDRLG